MKTLIKIDRLSAWILFAGMLLYFISGYGMTKGLIDASFAANLHLDILTYIILAAFVIHTAYAIHLAFKRWQIWNTFSAVVLILFYILLAAGFIYVDRYYTKEEESLQTENTQSEDKSDTVGSTSTVQSTTSQSSSDESAVKTFTLAELAKYDGQNGNPAYLAVDGKIYDLTSVFQNGKHYSHYAGKELTNAFYSYHVKGALAKYPIVGELAN